jgi:dCTP deaminase
MAVDENIIDAGRFKVPDECIQPASVDLHLGEWAYRIRCSFLPGDEPVEQKLKQYEEAKISLRDEGALLEVGCSYLVELKERLYLPRGIRAKANPKSSTGRIDVFTRIITDRGSRFDEIEERYSGPLYLEIVPLSFPVKLCEDLSLNQVRLIVGSERLSDLEIRQLHRDRPLLFHGGRPVSSDQLVCSDGLLLGLDLQGEAGAPIGYSARDGAPALDLVSGDPPRTESFWDPVSSDNAQRVILVPKRFYLLMSDSEVSIPPTHAAEMTAYDPTNGELRTHYAGFFDPGFGYNDSGRSHGSRAAMEVRAHDVMFAIENGQKVAKLTFERMLEEPERLYGGDIGSSYQGQTQTLSKYFRHDAADFHAPARLVRSEQRLF